MVYVILMFTLLVLVTKIPFSQDSQINKVQIRKSYFVPFEPIEWLENLHVARTDMELLNYVVNSLYVSWPVFYSQTQLWKGGKKVIC